ncbi:7836_t:CDS:2 [Scutellospora calospora]|uniref:7836_t:CDS:1 n=1 Tax=Scutellospora calospora TaxID=85575 RepID=A0ACA9JTU0_9GLOM|nr:7836_t:CDS:2 [Scutellospora calospora]
MGCQFCNLKGVSNIDASISHIYFPLKYPTKNSEESYNTKNLPLYNYELYLNKPTIYTQVFSSKLSKQYNPQQVIWIKDSTNLNKPIEELRDWEVKYARLHTDEGYMLGSLMSMTSANSYENAYVMEFDNYEFVDVSMI